MIDCIQLGSAKAWRVTTPMTQIEATRLLVAGQELLAEDAGTQPVLVDLAAVTEADSTGIAVLLDWLRTARQQGREMTVDGVPGGLRSLAELYRVEEFLNFV